MIRFGNNVGPEFGVKTRRSWHPNIVNKKLYSKALQRQVQVRVSTRVLRTIDKLGGLDEYLLGEKEARIKTLGQSGWWLRWAIMQTPLIKRRFGQERHRLGVPQQQAALEKAEVAEAQEVIEEASEAETAFAEEHGEAVATDEAFQIEQPRQTPALKFRVGPRTHVILTSQGWRRVRPNPKMQPHYKNWIERLTKALVKEKANYFRQVLNTASVAERNRAKKAEEEPKLLSKEEKQQLLEAAMKGWEREAKAEAEKILDRRLGLRREQVPGDKIRMKQVYSIAEPGVRMSKKEKKAEEEEEKEKFEALM
jgi:ribosomal protein L28